MIDFLEKIIDKLSEKDRVRKSLKQPVPIKYGRWYEVSEGFPPATETDDNGCECSRVVVIWSDIYYSYHLAAYYPEVGWKSALGGERLNHASHWLDADIPFPWKIREGRNIEKAEKLGLR